MKKTFFIFYLLLISIVLLFALCGCNNTKTDNSTNLELIQKDIPTADNTSSSDLQEFSEDAKIEETDEEFSMTKTIWLKENPTTGYQWSYEIKDETIAVVEGDEYTPNNATEGMAGAGGVHAFRLSGLKEGQTTITFNYSRSWESVEPIKTEAFIVTTDSNSLISVVKSN